MNDAQVGMLKYLSVFFSGERHVCVSSNSRCGLSECCLDDLRTTMYRANVIDNLLAFSVNCHIFLFTSLLSSKSSTDAHISSVQMLINLGI